MGRHVILWERGGDEAEGFLPDSQEDLNAAIDARIAAAGGVTPGTGTGITDSQVNDDYRQIDTRVTDDYTLLASSVTENYHGISVRPPDANPRTIVIDDALAVGDEVMVAVFGTVNIFSRVNIGAIGNAPVVTIFARDPVTNQLESDADGGISVTNGWVLLRKVSTTVIEMDSGGRND